MKKTAYIVVITLLSAACTSRYASNGENVYMKSQNGPFLMVPPPLFKGTISHFYDLSSPASDHIAVGIMPPAVS